MPHIFSPQDNDSEWLFLQPAVVANIAGEVEPARLSGLSVALADAIAQKLEVQ